MDMRYPGVIAECAEAMGGVMPASRVLIQQRVGGGGAAEISSYSNAWPCFFPQHGPGRKHTRPIFLADWQRAVIAPELGRFVRGLIHSDGCRTTNRTAGREYPRYLFSQVSDDIQELFEWACAELGIGTRRTGRKQISIARAADVARLDAHVGAKS